MWRRSTRTGFSAFAPNLGLLETLIRRNLTHADATQTEVVSAQSAYWGPTTPQARLPVRQQLALRELTVRRLREGATLATKASGPSFLLP